MNSSTLTSKLRRFLFIFGVLFIASFSTVYGQTFTFAQFSEANGTNDFLFTNNAGSSGTFSTISGGSPVDFRYFPAQIQCPPNPTCTGFFPASISGTQAAHVFVTSTTTSAGSVSGGTLTQPLNQFTTIRIIRDTPAPVGVGSGMRTNLLTAVFSSSSGVPSITGADGGQAANLSATVSPASPDHVVTFTSDFINFSSSTSRNLGLSFSSVTPSLSLGAGSILQTLAAAGTGTFASDPRPIFLPPSAAGVSVAGRVLTLGGQGIANATVTLNEVDGTVHYVRTGSYGYFEFPDLAAGQTVIVSVRSKRGAFNPQVVSLNDSIADLDFVALP